MQAYAPQGGEFYRLDNRWGDVARLPLPDDVANVTKPQDTPADAQGSPRS